MCLYRHVQGRYSSRCVLMDRDRLRRGRQKVASKGERAGERKGVVVKNPPAQHCHIDPCSFSVCDIRVLFVPSVCSSEFVLLSVWM